MHERPSTAAPALRLVIATLLAAVGAVLVLAGLASVARSVAGGSSPSASAVAIASRQPSPASSNPAASAPDASGAATPAGPVGSPLPSGDPVLVGAGDIGRCDGTADEDTAALVDGTPGIVFTLGDNAYEQGTDQQFRDCFGLSWGRFKDRIMLPVPGNHDHETDNAAGYRAYFGDAATPAGTTWYSRDIGAWHVLVLDSTCSRVDGGCGTDSPQGNWLRADLASSTARCTLALFHHPRFSSGEHGSDPSVAPFWDALYAAGADLVLNGHDHDYERFGPQDPQGRPDQARGIVEIVAGTGGADLRPFGASTPSGIARSSIAHGVLVLTLQPSGWAYRFVSTEGSFSDQGTGTCH